MLLFILGIQAFKNPNNVFFKIIPQLNNQVANTIKKFFALW